jgi:hypothetical protein
MRTGLLITAIVASTVTGALAQSGASGTRPRIVSDGTRSSVPIITLPPVVSPQPTAIFRVPAVLSYSQIRARIEEAKRELSAKPVPTSMSELLGGGAPVTIAFYDVDTKRLDYITVIKDIFLQKQANVLVESAASKPVTLQNVRVNGVNTPIVISDQNGKFHIPIMVKYPVERNGSLHEIAYYMSTHPGLVTPETVAAGKVYVRNIVDGARNALNSKGFSISPLSADIAERLSIVEHVDHDRFRTEYHPDIYNDVFTLYALNEGQTYRYSVSTAGAGGMIQMIPSTYQMIRRLYPQAGLMPDFVDGMRNHPNAMKAMLLYIQRTYDDLIMSPTVVDALRNGLATELELLSAGYNSNPAKLAGYIKRGGANWRTLIPRETQIYLEINRSMDQYVPIAGTRDKK